jgi:hypothetical protein
VASIPAGAASCPRSATPIAIQPAPSSSGKAGRNPVPIHFRVNVPAFTTHIHPKTPIPPSYPTTAIANLALPPISFLALQTQPAQQAAAPATPASARHYFPYKNESLPPQTIAGIYVEGYRYSRTIPAGYEGNNRDMTTVTEYWTAPDLGIQMRSVTDDPRNGKTTTEVTDLQQTAPDPTLFQPPTGYTIRDTNPQ